jgi:hypothetical protein
MACFQGGQRALNRSPWLPFTYGAEKIAFDLRLAIGHRWFKLLGLLGLLGHVLKFEGQYAKKYPPTGERVGGASGLLFDLLVTTPKPAEE